MLHEERGLLNLLLAARRCSIVNRRGKRSALVGSSASLLWLPLPSSAPLHSSVRTPFATLLLCSTALVPFPSPLLFSALVPSTFPLLFATALTVPSSFRCFAALTALALFRYSAALVTPVPIVAPTQYTTAVAVHD